MKPLFVISVILLLASSCSGTHNTYYRTIKLAITRPADANVTLEETESSPSDLLLLKRGDRPSALLALAFIENNRHKWISADKAILVMEKGRIIKTLGFQKDLLYVTNLDLDPLKTPTSSSGRTWSRLSDWGGDEYGHPIESQLSYSHLDTLNHFDKQIEVQVYKEQVRYLADSEFIRPNRTWENIYWYSKANGTLLKSYQKLSPITEPFEMTFLSRIARLN